jgi:hypothetical protein
LGYDVHITRAESWLDAEQQPITLDAWLQYVRSDPEMRVVGHADAHTDGGMVVYENAGITIWTAYSGDGVDDNHAWFDLQAGCLVVKNPDVEILRKMFRVAAYFGAQVQGDDGENYGPDGEPISE